MRKGYCVEPYNIDRFCFLLAESSRVDEQVVKKKGHISYFKEYFEVLHTKTIIVEWDYVDRDYLEDFSGYYVRCFTDYSRRCSRFHFFSNEFQQSDFEALLTGDSTVMSHDLLEEAYIGFIVVKPLPQTIFGRTCLKTYPEDNGRRMFPILIDCHANLFGLSFSVKSLPFQEQDSVVAACATSALWSVFHGTGNLFHHSVPSPVEITKAAGTGDAQLMRSLPNNGLTIHQMANAVSGIGLEPALRAADNEYLLKSTLYAYTKGGIPSILLFDLFDVSSGPGEYDGGHAVAITGYSLGRRKPAQHWKNGILLEACRVDKIYVHDDQVGPFARMVFDQEPLLIETGGGVTESLFSLCTSWIGKDGSVGSIRAAPQAILIPLYHKIRIPFQVVHKVILQFDAYIESLRDRDVAPIQERLMWDVYLTSFNDLKIKIQKSTDVPRDAKKRFLTASMPHYIWRANATSEGKGIIDLMFDATDIEQGGILAQVIENDHNFGEFLHSLANDPNLEVNPKYPLAWKVLSWFRTPKEK